MSAIPPDLHDKYLSAFLALGWLIDPTNKLPRCTVMTRPDERDKVFIGHGDIVRRGRRLDTSRPINAKAKAWILMRNGERIEK